MGIYIIFTLIVQHTYLLKYDTKRHIDLNISFLWWKELIFKYSAGKKIALLSSVCFLFLRNFYYTFHFVFSLTVIYSAMNTIFLREIDTLNF